MRKEVAADLPLIYASATAHAAEQRLTELEAIWDADYRSNALSWRRNWTRITPFFDYPPEIRKVIKLAIYLDFYNRRRPHSSLDRQAPDDVYFNQSPLRLAA